MKIRNLITMCFIVSTCYAGSAFAQNLIELSDDPAAPQGGTTTIAATWTDNDTASTSLQFDIDFDDTAFTFNSCTVLAPYNTYVSNCALPEGDTDTVRFLVFRVPTDEIPSGTVFEVTFDVIGSPGAYQMVIPPGSIVTNDGDENNTDPANINILGASYDSTNPAPGVAIDFGTNTAGDANPTNTMTIDNDGEAGTTLNGSCSLGGADPDAFILTGDTPYAVDEAGPNAEVTVSCESEILTVGNYSSVMSCTHDGDSNPASPVDYALSCDIVAAPAPTLSSAPQAPGVTIDFGTHSTVDPDEDAMLSITNSGNLDPLTGECEVSNDGGGVFSLAGDPVELNEDNGDPALVLTLTCNTESLGDFAGELTCTHDGSNGPTSTWPLACEVAPLPQYDSAPTPGDPLPALSGDQGDADPTTPLSISNVGEAGSTLTGTCSLTGPDDELYIDGGGGFSVLEGDAAQITVACDATAAGAFSNTLSCTHNDGDDDPSSPVTYAVACEIGPPDPAIYASAPYAPGDTIDVNEGNPPPPEGGTEPTTVLTISNAAETGDDFLDLQECTYMGDPEITASPDLVTDDLDPGASVDVTFTCATDTAGTFAGSYDCPFDDNPSAPVEGPDGNPISPATYPVECEVRPAFSSVEVTPPSGTPQTADLMPGDSHVFTFTFEETEDEGLDASLDDCTLDTATDFAITDPASFPQPIPSGGTETVDVTFTDPGVGDTFTDTLTCAYTEAPEVIIDEPEGGVEMFVSWPLEITVTGRNVTFLVSKDFDDDNPAEVEVSLSCNTGLPLEQTTTIAEGDPVNFVIVDFEPGEMDCGVSEVVPDGYEVSYFADIGEDGVAESVSADEDGCHYEGLESADFICEISNELQPVEVVVNKEWVDDNPSFNLPTIVEVTLFCNAEIVNGFVQANGLLDTAEQHIDPANPGVFFVLPDWDGSTECFVEEEVDVGVLPDLTDCESIPLAPGVDGECTIVNTRLFAGIPTLSQYGLLLMALLMLGMGAVAFRRYI